MGEKIGRSKKCFIGCFLINVFRSNAGNSLMLLSQLYKWCLLGAWHSAVAFGGWYLSWPAAYSDAGAGLQAFGAVVAATSVVIVNLKV